DSFWLANPGSKLTGFSPVIGAVDGPQGMRTRAGVVQINAQLSSGRMTLADVTRVLLANRNYLASLILDDLLAACREAPTPSSREACDALAKWDRTNNLDSLASHVFREWLQAARAIRGIWRVPFDRHDPLNKSAGLNL